MSAPPRAALDIARVRESLRAPWTAIEWVEVTESTNADLIGAAAGSVLVADYQRAGRGRLDRAWTSPPRAGLTFSALVRPDVSPARWGWLPLLTGVALCDAVSTVTGVAVALKWPNDLLAVESEPASEPPSTPISGAPLGKLAGILVQVADGAAIIGVGLNVSTTREELPVPTATSLALHSARTLDRATVLIAILTALGTVYQRWVAANGDAEASGLADEYRTRCVTIGQDVLLTRQGDSVQGSAVGIDADGRLRIRSGDGEKLEQTVAAGDIVHLRPTGRLSG